MTDELRGAFSSMRGESIGKGLQLVMLIKALGTQFGIFACRRIHSFGGLHILHEGAQKGVRQAGPVNAWL